MAESLNTRLLDVFTRRSLRIGRVETQLRRVIATQLRRLEQDILDVLKLADPFAIALLRRRRRVIQHLLDEEVVRLVTIRYSRVATLATTALVQLAEQEADATRRIVNDVAQETVILEEVPTKETLRRRVEETLIPTPTKSTDLSATGEEWWKRQGEALAQRLHDQWLVSAALSETLVQATARVRGTAEAGFQDGIMARARTDAERLLRTEMTNAVSEARDAVAQANQEKGLILIHSSILDSRTSLVCLGRHGLRYTLEHEPIGHSIPYLTGPPYHPNCRSTIIVGTRDGGVIPPDTLTSWLRRQGEVFQDELVGPTRARMFREGRLTPRQLLDSASGVPLTLEELGV